MDGGNKLFVYDITSTIATNSHILHLGLVMEPKENARDMASFANASTKYGHSLTEMNYIFPKHLIATTAKSGGGHAGELLGKSAAGVALAHSAQLAGVNQPVYVPSYSKHLEKQGFGDLNYVSQHNIENLRADGNKIDEQVISTQIKFSRKQTLDDTLQAAKKTFNSDFYTIIPLDFNRFIVDSLQDEHFL